MWCRGCGYTLSWSPSFSFWLQMFILMGSWGSGFSSKWQIHMHEGKPHTAKLPYCGPPAQLRHPFFWHRILMLNDNSSGVSGYVTLGSWPPQHVDAQRVWLVALLTMSSGCQLTAGRSNCPTQPFQALSPMSNVVSISNVCVLETFLSPSSNVFSHTMKLTHFVVFGGNMPI